MAVTSAKGGVPPIFSLNPNQLIVRLQVNLAEDLGYLNLIAHQGMRV
jgi:hypothetical protein